MSIYIRGIEMPKDGAIGVVIYSDGRVTPQFGVPAPGRAVPVPDHGRLVDADALLDAWDENHTIPSAAAKVFEKTVIPADRKEAEA